jgi:hypothetical protein
MWKYRLVVGWIRQLLKKEEGNAMWKYRLVVEWDPLPKIKLQSSSF